MSLDGLYLWPTFHASVAKTQNGNWEAPVMVPITIILYLFFSTWKCCARLQTEKMCEIELCHALILSMEVCCFRLQYTNSNNVWIMLFVYFFSMKVCCFGLPTVMMRELHISHIMMMEKIDRHSYQLLNSVVVNSLYVFLTNGIHI